ncbi:MAG: ABC transporter substrate-binding protein [Gemmatimonadetes bacterium]|nr:ABC transporter substrate-binding protein [Gemmatimonadota bacterium]
MARRSHRVLVSLVAATLAGCAGNAPRPDLSTEIPPHEEVQAPVDRGFAGEVRTLLVSDPAAAEQLVRDHLAGDSDSPAELRVLLGDALRAQGRDTEALLQYSRISGMRGGAAQITRAYDGIAEIRRRGGDEAAAVLAELYAWDASTTGDRDARERRVVANLERLPMSDLNELRRSAATLDAGALVRTVADRRAAGEGAVVCLLAPRSGKFEKFGDAFTLGARIALRDRSTPTSGAIGLPVRLVERDSQGDVLTATNEVRAAITNDDALAVIGPLLSVTSMAAGAVSESYGVPLIAPTATDPAISQLGRHVLTLAPDPEELTGPLAEFAVHTLGKRRFGVLLARSAENEAYERAFRSAVEFAGGEVAVTLFYEVGERDFRRLLERLDDEAVDAVYVPGAAADLEALAAQLDFYEFDKMILGHGGWTDARLLDPANVALEGAIFAVEAADHPESPFRLRLRELVWQEAQEEVTRFHVRGYTAMTSLLAAIDAGARTGDELATTLAARRFWSARPESEEVILLTFRDGVLGPASWASGFDLVPKVAPSSEEENDGSSTESKTGAIPRPAGDRTEG